MSGQQHESTPDGAGWLAAMDCIAPLFELPSRLHPASAWTGHIPFLFLLFKLTRPRIFVELGVHHGTSFLAACEAAKCFDTGSRCAGVDTWQGDVHAGFYTGDAMYNELKSFVGARYPSCDLIRTTFDGAVDRFEDATIDLLHIDGLHTYDAVSHDFQNWRPKLSDRSIVLFHDTEVRERGFGIWKFWSEVKHGRPHLDFQHSFGLGVLGTGDTVPEGLDRLLRELNADAAKRDLFKVMCEAAGATLAMRVQRRDAAARVASASDQSKSPQAGRNDPCPCGSGKRYKHCHGALV